MKNFPSPRGVTLVELLVAVALLSLIMVAFYTVFRGGSKAYKTGEERVELIQNARIALDMMVSQIRQALPPDASANPEIKFEIIDGTSIKFFAPIDSTPGAEEITFSASSYTLYKKTDNPIRWYTTPSPGEYKDPAVSSNPVTAALPGTEGVVSNLKFEEKDSDGLIRITMLVSADPTDASEKVYSFHAIVKAGFRYGLGLSGEF